MLRTMLIPWGLQKSTDMMVRVDDVPNGKACGCVCPACRVALVAKNQGTRKAQHFAHAAPADNQGACEGFLHATAKRLLYERIQRGLTEGVGIPIQWQCEHCLCCHSGNLLKAVTAVRLETKLPDANIRPDIFLEKEGRPWTLVEIVNTHEPEPTVHEYVSTRGIRLLVFNVDTPGDLDNLRDAPLLEPQKHGDIPCNCKLCPWCKQVRLCETNHMYCNDCGMCVEDSHTYCEHCGMCVEDTVHHWCEHCGMCLEGVRGAHMYCYKCGECVNGFLGAHGHYCDVCGKVLEGIAIKYGRHFCCRMQRKYGLPPCPERGHGHCNQCGKLTGLQKTIYGVFDGIYWQTCYSCTGRKNRRIFVKH